MKNINFQRTKTINYLSKGYAFCMLLLIIRMELTDRISHLFLVWNLFLASVPLAMNYLLVAMPGLRRSSFILVPFVGIWLLFLPNAFYVVTDFIHLQRSPEGLLLFDVVLIGVFALASLISGFLAMEEMRLVLRERLPKRLLAILTPALLLLCGYGIYLGRALRWNSWDILTQPDALLQDCLSKLLDPTAHRMAWITTLGMGIFLNGCYLALRRVISIMPDSCNSRRNAIPKNHTP